MVQESEDKGVLDFRIYKQDDRVEIFGYATIEWESR